MVAKSVTKIIKTINENSVVPLYIALRLIIVVGNKVSVLIFNKTKVIIALEGWSFLFSFCNISNALSPNGVAAEPRPSILATILEQIYSIQTESLSTSGKRKDKGFFNNFVIFFDQSLIEWQY